MLEMWKERLRRVLKAPKELGNKIMWAHCKNQGEFIIVILIHSAFTWLETSF